MEVLIILGLIVFLISILGKAGCDHDYIGHTTDMYRYSTHKCTECNKVEKYRGYFNVSSMEWECETCGQCLSHMKCLK